MKAEIKRKEVIVALEVSDKELFALRDLVGNVPSAYGEPYGLNSDEWVEMYRVLKDAHIAVGVA